MSELSPQRKKVVVLASSVACMSAASPMLVRRHPVLEIVWIGLMAVALVFVFVEFSKLKRENR
jgi:energy-converting hydrogenase Eha subunit C